MTVHSISMGVIMKNQNTIGKKIHNGFFKFVFVVGIIAMVAFIVLTGMAMLLVPFYRSVKVAGLILFIVSAVFSLALALLARKAAYIDADTAKLFDAYNELIEQFNALEASVNATKAQAEAAVAELKAAPKAAAPKAAPAPKAVAPKAEPVQETDDEPKKAPAKKPAAKKPAAKKSAATGDVAALTKEVAKLNMQVANLNGDKPTKTAKTAKKD